MKKSNAKESRRNFIKTVIPVGGMLCFGCPSLLKANSALAINQEPDFSDRIKTEFPISYENFFTSQYGYYIRLMKRLAEYMGRDKLIAMLKRATDDNNLTNKPNPEAKSVRDYANPVLESEFLKFQFDYKVLELSDKVWEIKTTNCIYAKIFREWYASDIGYATMCHGDFLSASVYNPKLKLERTKTLMEGHDCCNHRYTWND